MFIIITESKERKIKLTKSLSALKYIKNNKRRTAVLVVSIGFFIMMMYSIGYILSGNNTPFKKLLIDQTQRVQMISIKDDADENELSEIARKLNELDYVTYAFSTEIVNSNINATVGNMSFTTPYTTTENIQRYLDYNNFRIIKGRIPQAPFEVIFSKKLLKNANAKVGDTIGSAYFKIVGEFDGDDYFSLGYSDGKNSNGPGLCILSQGKNVDYSKVLKDLGFEKDVYCADNIDGVNSYKKEIEDPLKISSNIIFIASTAVLSICLIVVISMYIRDRHQEWCLYRSIGFTSKDIFLLANRELLITFGLSIVLGAVLSACAVWIVYLLIIWPKGLCATAFMPNLILESATLVILIYALSQIPIFFALNRIKTIDAIEDDEF